jgi:aminoethylphosphonate catabolism LysR family transcriptional regulator
MNHAQLKAFHAVAREGGFTAAARSLGLTQPAVTVQVKAMEEAYRVELFHRRGRDVVPTRTGEELLKLTRRLFEIERETHEFLQAEGGHLRGQLRLAADGPYHIIALIRSIRAEFPGLDLSVSVGNSAAVHRALLDYEAEIGVLSEHALDDRFAVLSAVEHPIVLLMAADHPWAGRASVHITELDGQPMVLREPGSATRRRFEAALSEVGVKPLRVLEIGSREAVREAVAAGLGLGVVQAPEQGTDIRVTSAAISGAEMAAREFAICLAERRDSPMLRRLAALIR